MARIFISYRRSDSAHAAANLTDKLQQHFGQDSIFFDVDNIPLGVDFREHIGNVVGQCDVLLVIIGEKWAQSVDDQGNRRLDQPSDYVRTEIESALKRNIPVIPVLTGEAEMPTANDLPPSIQSIAFRNAAELSAGRDRHQHMARLIRGLEEIVSRKPLTEGKTTPDKDPVHDIEQRKVSDEGDDSSELLEEIQKALKGFADSCVFVGKTVPPNKINNAINAYAPEVSPEDVLLLYDSTLFGGAKDGLLLTADAVYWRNSAAAVPDQIRYSEILVVDFRKTDTSKWIFNAKILINEKEILLAAGEQDKIAESLANVIRHLKSR